MEEVSSCSHGILNLGPGCTAPPPTPVRKAGLADTTESISHYFDQNGTQILWNSAATPVEVPNDDGIGRSLMSRNASPPSRAELDELAVYLTQQSLYSTPTLLSSPSFRRRRELSPHSSMGAGVSDASDQKQDCDEEESHCQNFMVDGEQRQTATYKYSEVGFCQESKAGIIRTCKEEGAFYVHINDMHKAVLIGIGNVFNQYLSMEKTCLIGSCTAIRFSELMTSENNESGIVLCCPQEGSGFKLSLLHDGEVDANLRERVTDCASMFAEICKKLLKLLLEEVSSETLDNLRHRSLQLLLYSHKVSDQIFQCDEDVLLSIIGHAKASCGASKKGNCLLVILGNCLESLSQGKFKSPTLPPRCNLADEEYCFQVDLKYL